MRYTCVIARNGRRSPDSGRSLSNFQLTGTAYVCYHIEKALAAHHVLALSMITLASNIIVRVVVLSIGKHIIALGPMGPRALCNRFPIGYRSA